MNDFNIKKSQIIIVEDESIVAMDIERSLKRLGYEVPMIVSTGEEAISATEKILPDLVLMDIQLKSEMTGIEAASEIRKLFNVPVIFLTAFADEHTIQKAASAEAYGYILKPFEEVKLHAAIEVILKKHKAIIEKENVSKGILKLSEEHFRLFIESVKDYAIYILDKSGNIISWNLGAARISGYSAEEVIGKNFFNYFYLPEDIEKGIPEQSIQQVKTFGHASEERWRIRKDGLKFWAKITLTAIYGPDSVLAGYGIVVHDLTKVKQEEEILKKAIESRDEFLSIASHELKTPLTILQLQSQLFKRNVKKGDEDLFPKEKIEQLVDLTIKQVQKLTLLVEDMLDISRIRTGKLTLKWEQFNLRELIQEIIERNKDQFIAVHHGEPEFTYTSENIVGTWDKMRIEQVINNLISNSLLYAKGHPLKISLTIQGNNVLIAVQDKGIGIAKENLKKIFNRFERAINHNEVSGLGLGLFIASQIVEAHKGKIWAESEIGVGSTFYVSLPLVHG